MAEFPTYEEMAKNVAEKALDDFLYNGKSIREWIQIIASEDCISRKSLKHKLQEHHDFFVNAYGGFSNLPQNDKSRVDEIINCIAMVVNEPSIQPTAKENLVVEDCISRAELLKAVDTWDKFGCDANNKLVRIKDCYVPYIRYDDVVKAIKGIPSIQPTAVVDDCISREEVCDYIAEFVNHEYATDREREMVEHIIGGIQHLPNIHPKPKTDVLGKIRTEIKEESKFCPLTEGLERALEIIDKHTMESKVSE